MANTFVSNLDKILGIWPEFPCFIRHNLDIKLYVKERAIARLHTGGCETTSG